MIPFLYQVASLFYNKYGAEISSLAFVFPNRRSGLFFQKYLGEIAEKPIFSPKILSINDLFFQLSGKQSADRLNMLFELYDIYREKCHTDESFDDFMYWGEMLLNDFDDVDKYMVDAKSLFSNISDLKEIEREFYYLSEEQIAAIRSFWSAFYPKTDSVNQEQFLEVWKILYSVYDELRQRLAASGVGYEGMIFREVVESMERGEDLNLPYEKIVFVGLNALSTVEEHFLKLLQGRGQADFYWDYASPKVMDSYNRASYFPLRNIKMFPSEYKLPKEKTEDLFGDAEQKIEVIGIPSGIGQAKQVYSILKELADKGKLGVDNALKTALVLPDEHLLIPVLNAIPEQIKRINVTMGYPLSGTPAASLMDYILTLQRNVRTMDGEDVFYYRDVLPVLNHRYVSQTADEEVSELVAEITSKNRIYITASELSRTELLKAIFTPVRDVARMSDYLISILEQLNHVMRLEREEDEDEELQRAADLDQEFIFHYFTTLNKLKDMISTERMQMRVDTYARLLRRIVEGITIPFRGEPLSGLQIMGLLETRALDFDRVILLSMNEGVFPKKKATNTFIPYNLRKGFGLPTYEHQESIWAYHFYRLIYRAKSLSFLYDTRTTGQLTGEVSRYVHQLTYHYEEPIERKLAVYDISSFTSPTLVMPKTDAVMTKLEAFKESGTRAFSASSINSYISCPLKFYFSAVEEIREENEVSENIEANVFGDIMHNIMEILYEPFCKRTVTADIIDLILKDKVMITKAIEVAFAKKYFKSEKVRPLIGRNYLIGEIIRKYVRRILEIDKKMYTPFIYFEGEKKIFATISLTDGSAVRLKGFIDRLDEVEKKVRVVDYKSGGGNTFFGNVEELFDENAEKRNEKVMQVFLYSWMYGTNFNNYNITPCIYFAQTMFGNFDPYLYQRIGSKDKEKVESFASYREDFENALRGCLDKIFDRDIPFYQTENTDACTYCTFKTICGR